MGRHSIEARWIQKRFSAHETAWKSVIDSDEDSGNESHDAPRKAPYESDELVQVRGARPAECSASKHDGRAERVLRPLDARGGLARAPLPKQRIFHDAHRWKELKRDGEQDRKRVKELNGLSSGRARIKINEHDGLDVRSEGKVGERARTAEKD